MGLPNKTLFLASIDFATESSCCFLIFIIFSLAIFMINMIFMDCICCIFFIRNLVFYIVFTSIIKMILSLAIRIIPTISYIYINFLYYFLYPTHDQSVKSI